MMVLPGTEGMAGYRDYRFHFIGFLKGLGFCAVRRSADRPGCCWAHRLSWADGPCVSRSAAENGLACARDWGEGQGEVLTGDPHRLLLITASAPGIQRARRTRVLNFQQITMPYLAALVPPGWEVTHVDEAVERVDVSAQVDLVGITFHTPSAPHVYDLADEFRRRGVAVALGGPHVSLIPDEAQEHADAIFVGEAELHWPRFLQAFTRGQHRAALRGNRGALASMTLRWRARICTIATISRPAGCLPRVAAPTPASSARWP